MSKDNKKDIKPDDVKKVIDDVFQGAEGLNKAKEMLGDLQEKLKSFQGGFLKNEAVEKAKAKHKGVLAGTLIEVLQEFPDANLESEAARVEIAKRFVDKYDEEVMSAVGM